MLDIKYFQSVTMKGELSVLFVIAVLDYVFVWPFNNFGADIITFCRCEICCTRFFRCCCCRKAPAEPKRNENGGGDAPMTPGAGFWIARQMLTMLGAVIAQTIYINYAQGGHAWERNWVMFMLIGVIAGALTGLILSVAMVGVIIISVFGLLYIVSIYVDDTNSANNWAVLGGVLAVVVLAILMRSCIRDAVVAMVLTIISSFIIVYDIYYFRQKDFTENTTVTKDLLGVGSCWEDRDGCTLHFAFAAMMIIIKLIVILVFYALRGIHCCCVDRSSSYPQHVLLVPHQSQQTRRQNNKKKVNKAVVPGRAVAVSAAPAAAAPPLRKARSSGAPTPTVKARAARPSRLIRPHPPLPPPVDEFVDGDDDEDPLPLIQPYNQIYANEQSSSSDSDSSPSSEELIPSVSDA